MRRWRPSITQLRDGGWYIRLRFPECGKCGWFNLIHVGPFSTPKEAFTYGKSSKIL